MASLALLAFGITLADPSARAEESPRYATRFEEGAGDWKATPPAELSPHGRSGNALKLSTYVENGREARWTSPRIAVEPGDWTVSAWLAQNLAYAQDAGYGGLLAAVLYDPAGKEIAKVELVTASKPPYRGNSDHYHMPEKNGLEWRYTEAGLTVPPNAAAVELVFTWSQFMADWRQTEGNLFGEVYLDDVVVTTGKPRQDLSASGTQAAPLAFRLRVNTPVYANTFLKSDPLEFTVRLDGPDGPPAVESGLTLKYRVEDFQRLLIATGEVALSQPYYYWRPSPTAKEESLVKTFYLGETVRREVGKWMAVHVSLFAKDKKLAEGEHAFLITDTRVLTPREAGRAHFFGADVAPRSEHSMQGDLRPWGQAPTSRYNQLQKKGAFGVHSQGWDTGWKRRQPTADSPISFAEDHPGRDYPQHGASRQTFEFHERNPLRYHEIGYAQVRNTVPDWAVLPGKTRRDGDFIDPHAFVKYVEAFVRHTDAMTYMTVGLEGAELSHFPILARAAYEAVKRVDRRLRVLCQVDFLRGASYAKELCDNGLIDSVDVLAFDYYTGRLGASCREFREYAESRGKYKEYWIPEYSYTGSYEQEERTRRLPDFCLWALANGIDKLRWYANWNPVPHVRGPIAGGWGQTGILEGQDEKLSPGATVLPRVAYNRNYSQGNLFPFLQEAMLYNLYQNFGIEEFRAFLEWDPTTEGVLFDGDGYSTACVWRKPGQPRLNLVLDSGHSPYELIDMYGRRRRVAPVDGKSVITVGQNPLMFRFKATVPAMSVGPAAGVSVGASQTAVAPGGRLAVAVAFANPFGRAWAGEVRPAVGGGWRVEPESWPVAAAPGESVKGEFTLTAPEGATPGCYPLIVVLDSAAGPVGVLDAEVRVSPPVGLTLDERPYLPGQDAAVLATVHNGTAVPLSGVVEAQGDFGGDQRPPVLTKEVTVAPGAAAVVEFPFAGWVPNLNRDYPVHAAFRAVDGAVTMARRSTSFRGVPRRTGPVVIDGQLDDWDTDRLVWLDFFLPAEPSNLVGIDKGGNPATLAWRGVADASGSFSIQWDDDRLYFAFRFTDDTYLPGGKGHDLSFWSWDSMSLALYPHGVQPEDTVAGVPYKEHMGLDAEGKVCYERFQGPVGDWFIGSGKPEGVEVAVVPTDEGVVMEFSVPFLLFAPLKPEPGARFAATFMYCDRDARETNKPGIYWYYSSTNVDMDPKHFGNFMLQ